MTIGGWIILLYTSIAFFSISLFFNKYSEGYFADHIYVFPYIFLWGMILLGLSPLLKQERYKVEAILLPSICWVNILCITVVLFCIFRIISSLPDLQRGLILLSGGSSDYILQTYNETTAQNMVRKSVIDSKIDIIAILTNCSAELSPLLFFIYLLYPNKNKWVVMGLGVAILSSPIDGIVKCSRVLIVANLFLFCFTFLLFREFLGRKVRRYLYVVSCIVLSFFFLFFAIISLGRAKGNIERNNWGYQRYFAESFLVFNGYCVDANGIREGNRTAPLFRMLLGMENLSPKEMRYKYRNMRVDSSRFSTYVGDFVLDFGVIFSLVIFIVLALVAFKLLKRHEKTELPISHFFLIYLIMKFNLGFWQYLFSGIGGNLAVLTFLLLFFFFRSRHAHIRLNIL